MSTGGEHTNSPRKKPRKLERRQGGSPSLDESNTTMETLEHEQRDKARARETFDRKDDELGELPTVESSFLNDEANEDATFDEGELRKHFLDVESSFIPDATTAHLQREERVGMDDTYLEFGKSGSVALEGDASRYPSSSGRSQLASRLREKIEPQAQTKVYETPEIDRNPDAKALDEHVNLSDASSSPAQGAAQRGEARVKPEFLASKDLPLKASYESGSSGSSKPIANLISSASTEPDSKGTGIRQESVIRPPDIALPQSASASSNSTVARSLRFHSRPTNLSRREMSQVSSVSSKTQGTDFSGDEAVSHGDAKHHGLQRLPSLGSVASYIDEDGDRVSFKRQERRETNSDAGDGEERPETPRAAPNMPEAPTDTVIAQHVRSIQVPDTVARDFRARNRSVSPEKQGPTSSGEQGAGIFQGLSRRTLTLKEQNGKIDKLTKENFDLKLKIHFLDQALQSRSDDGVKDLIDKNVQLQTDLANERKETQSLRRRMKDLERRVKDQEENLAEARLQQERFSKSGFQDEDHDDPTLQAEMHEEILHLRQQLDHSENTVTTLTEEVMTKELEKRKMAEHMRSMAGSRGEDTAGMKETMDMWQDLLNAETGRREQAEEDVRKLREELVALRIERATPSVSKAATRRSRTSADEILEFSNGINGAAGESISAIVEQLKHENAELRRDLGAQTSMLTSRNRERERLQQEIEDLKLLQRKSDGARSVTGESIFDRSISRAHQRAPSKVSENGTEVTEAEREDWGRKEDHLRDQNAELRLKYQDLERTHNTHLQYISALESDFQDIETELNESAEDLRALQSERDEALQAYEEKENAFARLEQEALVEIEKLEAEIGRQSSQLIEAQKKHQKTMSKLEHTTDGYKGLQNELRDITQSVMNLEDEKQANVRTIQTLEKHISEAEEEIQKWEQKCKEIDQKNRKLEITQESLHSEITFLREEQEGDKIKIGELEDALNAAQQTVQDERERLREVEEAVVEERQQRDVLENKSKEEVQKVLDDLNRENINTKDEVRKLRRGLSAKEVEATSWKQKLEELEQNLREILGDQNGTKIGLLNEIERIQRDLETTTGKLDRAKMDLADKERLLRHRDGLLESTSLESRRLSDLLDKERDSRKHDLTQFEKSSKGQASQMRTIAQQQTRMLELETSNTHDKRRMAALEQKYLDQLLDRNTLLFALWNRLSTLCGSEWAQSNSLVNGETPSVDAVARGLSAFSKNLIAAMETVEELMGSFKVRIRGVEKDLWKDYQTLEHNLDIRMRRMDSLERAVKDAQKAITEAEDLAQRPQIIRTISGKVVKGSEEIARLKSEIKGLKAELKFHRQHPSAMAQQMLNQQAQFGPEHAQRAPSSGSIAGKSQGSPARQIVNTLLRHHSTPTVEQFDDASDQVQRRTSEQHQQPLVVPTLAPQPNEQRWVHRLKEMEKRLKAEREGRLLDRKGARQRIEEERLEKQELRQMLEHARSREDSGSVAPDGPAESEMAGSDVHADSGVD